MIHDALEILQGKGFPDVATRALVKTLASNLPERFEFFRPPTISCLAQPPLRSRIPIMALVDGDPSGLSILATYMNGSTAMRHEDDKLAAGKRINWVGIHLSELSRWAHVPIPSDVQGLISSQIGSRQRLAPTHHESR